MAIALMFPGQGSQDVGMGLALAQRFPVARAVFEEVDDALSEKLSAIMWEGPKETLTLTENAQPALMAVSIAALRVLQSEGGVDVARDVAFVAGHSLGEYSALVAAGTFTVSDAARLLRLRGRAMQAAVPVGMGAMAALLGVGIDTARLIAAHAAGGEVCDVANDNDPGQVVLSGHRTAIERVADIGKPHGLRRAVMLPVSAPFHCALMQPAADAMAEALAGVTIERPVVPVVSNVSAASVGNPADIRRLLVEQVTKTVRWRECVIAMAAGGVTDMVEVGAGKVLAGLVKRIDGTVRTVSFGQPDDLAATTAVFAAG